MPEFNLEMNFQSLRKNESLGCGKGFLSILTPVKHAESVLKMIKEACVEDTKLDYSKRRLPY